MNMLMWVQKPHREDSRGNMSFHVNWWHYRGWECPGSTLLLIQHWHNKSQSIWPGRLNWSLLLEIIQIRCSQPATRFHPSSSRWHIFLIAAVSLTLSTLPLYIYWRERGNSGCSCSHAALPACSHSNYYRKMFLGGSRETLMEVLWQVVWQGLASRRH